MNPQRLQQIIDAYGAHPQRWPATERAAVQVFLQQTSDAQTCLQEAQKLDAWLDQLPEPATPLGLTQRILALSKRQPQTQTLWQCLWHWLLGDTPAQQIWRPALMLGLPLLLGVWLGIHIANPTQTSQQQAAIAAFAQSELQNLLDQELKEFSLDQHGGGEAL